MEAAAPSQSQADDQHVKVSSVSCGSSHSIALLSKCSRGRFLGKVEIFAYMPLNYDHIQAVEWCCLGVEGRMVSLDMGMQKTEIILKLFMLS